MTNKKVTKKATTKKMVDNSPKFDIVIEVAFLRKNPDNGLHDIIIMEVDEATLETRVTETLPGRQKNPLKAFFDLDIARVKRGIKYFRR